MTDLKTVLKPLTKTEDQKLDTAIGAAINKTLSAEMAKTANADMKEAFEKRFGKNRLKTNLDWTQYFLNSPSKNCLDSIHVDVYNWGRDMFCEKLSPDYAAIREFCDDGDIKGTAKATFTWLNKEETYANKKLTFTTREKTKQDWQSLCNTEFSKYGKEIITGRRSAKVTKTGKEKFEQKLSSLFRAVNADDFEGNAVECNNLLNRFRSLGFKFKSE